MAGGPLAQDVVCMECLDEGNLVKAVRVHEGVESDDYACASGHRFGLSWSRGPATEAQWPPSPDDIAIAAAARRR